MPQAHICFPLNRVAVCDIVLDLHLEEGGTVGGGSVEVLKFAPRLAPQVDLLQHGLVSEDALGSQVRVEFLVQEVHNVATLEKLGTLLINGIRVENVEGRRPNGEVHLVGAGVDAGGEGARGEAQKPGRHLDTLKHHLVGEAHRLAFGTNLEAGQDLQVAV